MMTGNRHKKGSPYNRVGKEKDTVPNEAALGVLISGIPIVPTDGITTIIKSVNKRLSISFNSMESYDSLTLMFGRQQIWIIAINFIDGSGVGNVAPICMKTTDRFQNVRKT